MSRKTNFIRKNKAAKRQRQQQRDLLDALRHVEKQRTAPYHLGLAVCDRLILQGFIIHTGYDRQFALTDKGKCELYQPRAPWPTRT